MPPFQWRVFWIGITAGLLYSAVMHIFNPPPGLVFGIVGSVYSGAILVVAGRRGLLAWRARRAVHLLRRFDAAKRTTMLSALEDEGAKAYLEYRLADHGAPETAGLIERFTFSPIDRRETLIVMWTSIVAAAGLCAAMVTLVVTAATRALVSGGVFLLVGIVATLQRSASKSRRIFEVSPFGLSEIASDGTVRRLLWGYGLTLRNRPWLRRIELSPTGDPAFIGIPYRVVGFERLVELILTKGGFSEMRPDAGD